MVLGAETVLETIIAVETTVMSSGKKIVSRPTTISLLWQKIDGKWRLAYLHASEIPQP